MQLDAKFKDCDWKKFEQLISEVLKLHDYETFWNVNLTINKKRRQFDVVANKPSHSLLIECKKWCNKKSKISGLKTAVVKHKKRCEFYKQLMNTEVIPLIVIYKEEPIKFHKKIFIVPLNKLNNFILGLPGFF